MTRTLLTWNTATPPQELYELVREASTILFMTETPNEKVTASVDHLVVWNDPQIEVDHRTLLWPADADLVRRLLRARTRRRLPAGLRRGRHHDAQQF